MNPKTFLDQPIKAIDPGGWCACLDCRRYFTHQAVYCPSCGKKIVAWTEVSISDFIRKTATDGTAPLNSVYFSLKRIQGAKDIFEPLTPENRAIYNYAKEIRRQALKKQK